MEITRMSLWLSGACLQLRYQRKWHTWYFHTTPVALAVILRQARKGAASSRVLKKFHKTQLKLYILRISSFSRFFLNFHLTKNFVSCVKFFKGFSNFSRKFEKNIGKIKKYAFNRGIGWTSPLESSYISKMSPKRKVNQHSLEHFDKL